MYNIFIILLYINIKNKKHIHYCAKMNFRGTKRRKLTSDSVKSVFSIF